MAKYYSRLSASQFAVSIVIDPRLKLGVYDKTQDPEFLKDCARKIMNEAFLYYSGKFTQLSRDDESTSTCKSKWGADPTGDSELDIYLSEARIMFSGDILEYWRNNATRFPILSKMARDYLVKQPTGKDIEGTFSKGRRTVPYYRRSQNADTIRDQMLVNSGYTLGLFNE